MADQQPNVADFRSTLAQGYQKVRDQLRDGTNSESIQAVLSEYHRIFGLLDSMTNEERSSPLATIDASRLRRIARGAGTTDQELIQVLFSYQNYCEVVLRATCAQRRGRA